MGVMILLSMITVSSLAWVRSFSSQPICSGKYTLTKQGQHIQHSSTINEQQPLHRQLGATDGDNCGEIEADSNIPIESISIIGPNTGATSEKKAIEGVRTSGTMGTNTIFFGGTDDGYDGLGEYDPSENLPQTQRDVPNVGDPQLRVKEKDWSVTNILKELAAIQQQGPKKYCILGTRHCSFLIEEIIELLAYALVLSGNHVYTSGAPGTNAATVRGALRAEREDLLTVVLPQSLEKQTKESQELLEKVDDLITMPQNDDMPLDVASQICNSYLLSLTDQLISFAFHESTTVIEANKEAKALDMLVTTLYLD